ncbi:putative Ig domain-containing protein [Herbaspirillum rhizosphaerae]|uniref:putative Ig domain-containing protein n=1 Tax=Herbaspirillum rhizosphaerae TaxID=346179 RepID=UPI00067AAA3D|nr:putative Ig domain-containing protein [Herbaspirillum rhizosphaerae]
MITPPSNGSLVAADLAAGDSNTWINYSNSGNGQLTDTFTLKDDSNNPMVFNITISAPTSPLTVSPTASANPVVAQSFTQQMSTTGGTSPYTYALVAGSLPPGITFNGSTGAFSGSATASGGYNFSIKVTDSAATPNTFTKAYQMNVGAATLVISPGTLPNGTATIAYSQQMSVSGGIAPYSYAMDTTSFPGGGTPLGINSSTGVISGTPTTAGTATFRIVVTDSTSGTAAIATANYSMTIDPLPPPVAGPVNLPVAYNSTLNAATLSLSGGPVASVAVPTAPLHGAILISGTTIRYTPTIGYNGPDSFTYTATNAGGTSAPATVSVTMTAPTVTVSPSGTALSATTTSAFSQSFSASGGSAPYTYSQTGTLPTGLSFNAGTATLSGTPTQAGSFSFTINATDSSTGTAVTGSRNYTLSVTAPTLTLVANNVNLERGVPAPTIQFVAGGGTAPYTYAVTTPSLPAGLNLSASSGAVTGTPTVAGSYSYTITATDSNGFTVSLPMSGGIGPGAPIANAVSSSVAYNTGSSSATTIAASINASGGTAASLTVASGASHGTVSVLSATSFSYTPTPGYAGPDSFTYTATNSVGTSNTATVSITVSLPALTLSPSGPALSGATVGVAYSQTFTGSGGIPTYTYSVISGTLPNGLTLAGGTLSGTPTQSGTFNFTIKTQDGSTGAGAPFNTSNAYTLAVGNPTLGISPSSLTTPQVGIAFTQQLSTSGGTAPYAYTVTAGATPAGLNVSGTGLISGTPTAAGAYNFSVTSTDSFNVTATNVYSGTVGAGKPVTANSSTTVGYSSSNNSITATITGGTPTSLTVTTAAAHGTASPSGVTGFTYTPTAGYSGTDTFSYTATNAVGTSTVATVTVTIGAPTVIITPSTTWSATQGTSYTQTLTWSGGAAPYTAITVTGLPSGLTYSTSSTGATITGTPTQNGSFSVTASATDSSTPTPATKSQTFTLTVGQAIPVAVADSAATNANQAVTIPVTTNDTGAIASITVAGNPAHGAAVVSGLNIVYTPTANYFGSDSFTYTATGPGGTSSAATVTVAVAALAVPTSPPQSASVMAGQSVTLHVGAAAANGPITAVTIVGAPASGSAVVNGTDIVYTAAAGFTGNVQFTYTLSNVFGASALVTATVSASAVPVVSNQSVAVAAGATATVDVMAGATGGPFTAAAVGAINPSTAGTAAIVNAASSGSPSYRLNFTPAAAFSGVATVTYTLSNASGTSAAATVTITVGTRANAANDPQVKGLVAAHGQTASRFATAQLGNFSRRLESLHGTGWAPSSFGLGFGQPTAPVKPLLAQWSEDEVDRVVGSPLQAGMRKVGWPLLSQASKPESKAVAENSKDLAALPDLPSKREQSRQQLSLWIAGTVDFGQRNTNGQQEGFRFTTNGVSMGADYRLSDQLTIGVGTGYSRDRSDIGDNGSKTVGQAVVATVYGSVRPTPNIFIDGMLGYGALNFDSTRYVTDDGSFATGQRGGNQLFVALSSGYEFRGDSWMWSPYGKVDLASTTLAQYTETAAGNNALTYFKQRVRTSSGTFGLRTEGQYLSRFGMWTPRARVEYRRQFSGASEAGISYADLASSGPAYVIRSDDSFTGNWTAGLGMRLLLSNGASLIVDYSSNLNVGQGRYSSVLLGINVPLR